MLHLIGLAAIWIPIVIIQSREKKREKQFYMEKAREYSMKGETEQANMCINMLSRLK